NWARQINLTEWVPTVTPGNDWYIPRTLIQRTPELKFTNTFEVIEHPDRMKSNSGSIYPYPALTIPVQNKTDFECPAEHLDALKAMLPQVTKIVIIGWRGMETHFLALLRDNLPKAGYGLPCLVVCGKKDAATETHNDSKASDFNFNSVLLIGR